MSMFRVPLRLPAEILLLSLVVKLLFLLRSIARSEFILHVYISDINGMPAG